MAKALERDGFLFQPSATGGTLVLSCGAGHWSGGMDAVVSLGQSAARI